MGELISGWAYELLKKIIVWEQADKNEILKILMRNVL